MLAPSLIPPPVSTPTPIVLADYVTAPRISVSSGVSLGISLLTVVPKPTPQPVRLAATRLRGTIVDLQQAWARQIAVSGPIGTLPRDADIRVDRALRSTSMRIEAFTLLPSETVGEVDRAKAAYGRVFPEGLRFLNLPFDEQWAYGERLLAVIDGDEELAADVEELVGESILGELRAAQEAYGVALGITAPRTSPEVVSLLEPLAALRTAIVGYALQVIAMQDVDATRIPAARKALAPLDDLRARQGRRAASTPARPTTEAATGSEVEEDDSVTPQTPVPSIEDTEADLVAAVA
jgi:hypothetical protein